MATAMPFLPLFDINVMLRPFPPPLPAHSPPPMTCALFKKSGARERTPQLR